MDLAKGDVEVFCNLLLSDIVLVYIDFYFLEKFEILALCAESVDSALGNRLSTISAYLGTVTSCHISITLASKYENIRK